MYLVFAYWTGTGIRQDLSKALAWCDLAAEHGNREAALFYRELVKKEG